MQRAVLGHIKLICFTALNFVFLAMAACDSERLHDTAGTNSVSDPFAPCRQLLNGQWVHGDWEVEVDNVMVSARGPGFFEFDVVQILDCAPPETQLLVRGISGTATVKGSSLVVDAGSRPSPLESKYV